MSVFLRSLAMALCLVGLVFSPQLSAASRVRFFAFGDLPYTAVEAERLESLLSGVLEEKPPFLIHIGDVKPGNEPCTKRALGRMAELFRVQPVPVVYTPGDNEWTDCRREAAGGYDPGERLAVLRRLYFDDPSILRLQELGVSREDTAYPENYWFIHQGIFFATVHIVGSHNNLVPGDPVATAELSARSHHNRHLLQAAVRAANATGARPFVLLFHADPGFEESLPRGGFEGFHEDLSELLRDYRGSVLAIHGDSHHYLFDHPVSDRKTGRLLKRFTRLEVPGSPTVAGVWVSVDPAAKQPFSVKLVFASSPNLLVE